MKRNLTPWEVGQELIKASDTLSEIIEDINQSITTKDCKTLSYALALIGDVYNLNNDHKFGIYDSVDYGKEYSQNN